MTSARILVVEDDADIRQSLKLVLAHRGYDVLQAGDGGEGLRMARTYLPDLIITDVTMPVMDGWTMMQQLRAQPEFMLVPAIFLTAISVQEPMVETFKLGGLDYLPKPFKLDDVLKTVARALHRREQVESVLRARAAASTPPAALRSALDQVGLSSLLSVMDMELRSGVLVVARTQPAATGHLHVREGRVLRADLSGDPALTGLDAVFEMLSWQHGHAELQPGPVDGPDLVRTATTHLLVEGARLADEKRRGGAA